MVISYGNVPAFSLGILKRFRNDTANWDDVRQLEWISTKLLLFKKAFIINKIIKFYKIISWLWHSCFPVNFAKFPGTPFFTEHLWWLLLLLEAVTKCMIVFQVSLKFNLLKEILKIIQCHIFILMKKVNILRKIHMTMKSFTSPFSTTERN